MPPLKNPRHEQFAVLVAAGSTQADAYRKLYPKSKKWTDDAVRVRASQLHNNIITRVQEIQASVADQVSITKAQAIDILADALRRADPDRISATAAYSELAKSLGWYSPQKVDETHHVEADADFLDLLREGRGKRGGDSPS